MKYFPHLSSHDVLTLARDRLAEFTFSTRFASHLSPPIIPWDTALISLLRYGASECHRKPTGLLFLSSETAGAWDATSVVLPSRPLLD